MGKVLEIERVINAPIEKVWGAWTNPEQLQQWWSPDMFTIPRIVMDLRPGGQLDLDMKSPDGQIFPMKATYTEISEPNRLVFESSVPKEDGSTLFKVHHEVTFASSGVQTTLKTRWEVVDETPEAKPYLDGMDTGLNQSLDKLTKFVEQ